jgi:signal transduction histidine kinase
MAVSRVERPGEPPLAVAVLRDVSAARRLDETREEFLSTAAHELKTPLAVIRAYAQLLARREPADRRALEAIQRQVDRLSRLVQQLLDTSRLRLDPGPGRPEPLDLAALARDVMDRIRPSAPAHELEVRADGPVNVVAERERLGRVLTCLVDNAVRFSPGGGRVRLVVSRAGEEALVSVEDEGVGIPLDRQAQIFERYYRAHAGTPQDYGGLGLGLGMSREIVERHGGRMWFESSPGAGSKFHFGLPLRREDA